jgi:hypothetical protein
MDKAKSIFGCKFCLFSYKKNQVKQNADNGPLQKNLGSAAQALYENLQRVWSTECYNSSQMPEMPQ